MKAITLAVSIAALTLCSCTKPKSKAAEMNRRADSAYRADSLKIFSR